LHLKRGAIFALTSHCSLQTCAELNHKNAALKQAPAEARQLSEAAMSALQRQQHEQDRELRALVVQAHEDVAASRAITVKAEAEQRRLADKVRVPWGVLVCVRRQ
jgi:Spy/CpxP family protein refolding chaperone